MKTYTALEIKDIYLNYKLNYLSPKDHAEEMARIKYLVGCSCKPMMNHFEVQFIEYVENNVYKGHTTRDIFLTKYGIDCVGGSEETILTRFSSIAEAQTAFNECRIVASELIRQQYEEHVKQLNALLQSIIQ